MEILGDFQTTVRKALAEIEPNYEQFDGLVVCGTHSPHDWEALIEKIREARESGRPFLGICFGHQLGAIEYARSVLGIKDATSEEFGTEGLPVVKKLPELRVGMGPDGESYWHQYQVDPVIEKNWKKPDRLITCQFHPEYESSKERPHPLLVRFLSLCKSV